MNTVVMCRRSDTSQKKRLKTTICHIATSHKGQGMKYEECVFVIHHELIIDTLLKIWLLEIHACSNPSP